MMSLNDYTFATMLKETTKKAQSLVLWDAKSNYGYCDIYDAYERPSVYKVRSFERIRERAYNTNGYNHDLRVCGKNCMSYTTMYTSRKTAKRTP